MGVRVVPWYGDIYDCSVSQTADSRHGCVRPLRIRRRSITRIVAMGFFTNMCVETTVRSVGNLGYDTYMCPDACAITNRVGPDGQDHDPELVHTMSVASFHGEFYTALSSADAIGLSLNPTSDCSGRKETSRTRPSPAVIESTTGRLNYRPVPGSTRGSLGRPNTCSPMMLRWISLEPE